MTRKQETSFEDLHLPTFFIHHLYTKMDIHTPTQVQLASFHPIFSGKDVLMKSETGSGKTLAFLIPVVLHLGLRPVRINRNEGTKGIAFLYAIFYFIFSL